MEIRNCGTSDLHLSALGVGCWSFGGGEHWGKQAQKDAGEIVGRAIDLGITYFDTAEVYNDGRSESSLGQAIRGSPKVEGCQGRKEFVGRRFGHGEQSTLASPPETRWEGCTGTQLRSRRT